MTTYAVVGTGSRSFMYIRSMFEENKDVAELVALCDVNRTRMNYANEVIGRDYGAKPRPTYLAHEFEKMIETERPDRVIVTSVDRTHDRYITQAMRLGCDVVTEKPMTIDAEKCQTILDTIDETGRDLVVTFNYRYAPRNTKVKELIASGEIGDVLSVHFEWLLDTRHGADYFRRWHRDKANSGGLFVHKATHHFDLVNWWLDSRPTRVYARGRLAFYGRRNAEARGVSEFYHRSTGSEIAAKDPFAIDLEADENLRRMYLEAEDEDGYFRDLSVFGDFISIEDTMAALVDYENKAMMSYSLNAHCPWEGYRVMFNGSRGRIEMNVVENSYVSGSGDDINLAEQREKDEVIKSRVPQIQIQKHFGAMREVPYEQAAGGHGGGDVRLLSDVFRGPGEDPLGHAAGVRAGAYSILTGIAANRSLRTEQPVLIDELVRL